MEEVLVGCETLEEDAEPAVVNGRILVPSINILRLIN